MLTTTNLIVLYQHLISPEVSSGEPGAIKWPLILTVTEAPDGYTLWLTLGNHPRRILHARECARARFTYETIKAMPYDMAKHHWIEAGYNDY